MDYIRKDLLTFFIWFCLTRAAFFGFITLFPVCVRCELSCVSSDRIAYSRSVRTSSAPAPLPS